MPERSKLSAGLCAALLGAGLISTPGWSQDAASLTDMPVPPPPSAAQIDQAAQTLGNPINKPVTGSTLDPQVIGGEPPPSLETLQASRPGFNPGKGLDGPRGEALREAALSYGARGGLAARSFAINEMLRKYQAQLDATYDFSGLVVSVDGGRTLIRPPVVTEAQLAFALSDGGQAARETGHIYEITREAQLASAPPNWRAYLVRSWVSPTPPPDDLRPRSDEEVQSWNKWVAEGWSQGEKQAVEIFLDDLSRLKREIIGMARYRVLLRDGLVEEPRLAFARSPVEGGRDLMRVDNTTIRITSQPGLNPQTRQWHSGDGQIGGPIGPTP